MEQNQNAPEAKQQEAAMPCPVRSLRIDMTPERVAKTCHEANKVLCELLGDNSQVSWEQAPEWQKNSALAGVKAHVESHFEMTPEGSHKSWLAQKEADGWAYGETKDAEKKTHPCIKPYAELPKEQQAKDFMFRAIVHALLK